MSGIELRSVSFSYPGGRQALRDVDLVVSPGERLVIIGQNGAGKTTAVKLMNGLLAPTAGKVFIDGADASTQTTAQLARRVGYVFQNPDDQIFSKSVADEVGYSLKRLGVPDEQRRERVISALRMTGLEEHADVNPLDLPYSTRRFVTIAVVLAIDPAYIVLDEPTAGQDRAGIRRLTELLDQLTAAGKGVVVISHDMEFVAEHFDRAVVMANQRVIADDAPRRIFWQESTLREARLERPQMSELAVSLGIPGRVLNRGEIVQRILSAPRTARTAAELGRQDNQHQQAKKDTPMSDTPRSFFDLFDGDRAILAMLHLSGDPDQEVFDLARKEIDVLYENGVDAVIVENYFGSVESVERVLDYLASNRPTSTYGVNVLGDDAKAFELANAYGASFIQLDSVAGHLRAEDDKDFEQELQERRASSPCFVLGGVRFKYQPVLSTNSVETDLLIARDRCDGVVVSSEGTGIETSPAKIAQFRRVLGGDFPLIVGAGLTVDNCEEQLALADGAIVGSYFKDTYRDTGTVVAEHVRALVTAVRNSSPRRVG